MQQFFFKVGFGFSIFSGVAHCMLQATSPKLPWIIDFAVQSPPRKGRRSRKKAAFFEQFLRFFWEIHQTSSIQSHFGMILHVYTPGFLTWLKNHRNRPISSQTRILANCNVFVRNGIQSIHLDAYLCERCLMLRICIP